jgi:DNA-directed RNA polymerase subunit RPC12/RpoP
MNEFKFDCPTCGQHILAAHEWIGREIDCPSCNTRLTIPPPQKALKKTMPIKTSAAEKLSKSRSGPIPPGPRAGASAKPEVQPPATPPASKVQRSDKPAEPGEPAKTELDSGAPGTPQQLRIPVLTPAIKLEIVHAVRGRIADESAWLPDKINGEPAYAAKVSDGQNTLVEVTNPEATRFSLIGAFLLEFHLRNVTRTAQGRTRLLNEEIPNAIRKVLLDDMKQEGREPGGDPLEKIGSKPITHGQSLAVLAALEERYKKRMEQARVEKASKTLGNIRLPDLIKKLQLKGRIAPEDVAAALYHELAEVRRRLDELESRATRDE